MRTSGRQAPTRAWAIARPRGSVPPTGSDSPGREGPLAELRHEGDSRGASAAQFSLRRARAVPRPTRYEIVGDGRFARSSSSYEASYGFVASFAGPSTIWMP